MGHPARAETLKNAGEIRIPAGTGAGLRVAAGEYVQIVDVDGRGCADFFALATSNPTELVPQPVNFFMNVAGWADGGVMFGPPRTEAGDRVLLRAFMDCLVVRSACPQQWNPATNYHPSDLLARILTR